ncbi:MAG: NAD(P)H-dependent flavin oxidoreductase YrpB (nitropropane dioxygenase family) [Gammaproteobacteria bacterium]
MCCLNIFFIETLIKQHNRPLRHGVSERNTLLNWIQIDTIEDARKAYTSGADAIIVQGNEAGGHTYTGMPLLALLPAVRDVAGDRLVLGAGGIADGRTAAVVLASGADGIILGTRLVATREANAHDEYKRRLLEANGEDTVITHAYGLERPAFNPMQIIRNQTVTIWENCIDELPKKPSQA